MHRIRAQYADAMFETQQQQSPGGAAPWIETREQASYATLLGQTMTLVALALIVFAAGSFIGRDLERGTAMIFSIAGFGMLIAQSFVGALRIGTVGTAWLFGLALAIGLGVGPALSSYVSFNPDIVAEAGLMTALIVLAAATFGTLTSKDLARWMKPLSLIVFGAVLVSWAMLAFGEGGNPVISGVIGLVSAALIVVDFNYLRRHGTENDVIWLATGIFVSIINIFLSMLNILDD